MFIVRAGESEWEPTGRPGIEARRLFVDRAGNRITMLVRMAPGTWYPGHTHGGPEECYVLQGDLRVADKVLHPGDYQRAAKGSQHGIQSTKNGCVLLLVSSLTDSLN
jgi:anti-sigma factor ChrR (cupin superfamily)